MVHGTARDLVEELGEWTESRGDADRPPSAAPAPRNQSGLRVLCIPLRDEADETAAIMLQQLLADDGMRADVAAIGALTGELVDSVEAQDYDVAAISVVPPLPPRSSRLLCRRLRGRYPDMPILVGCWSGACSQEMQDRLAAPDDAEIIPTLAAAVLRVRAIAGRGPLAEPEDKPAGQQLVEH
jgi:hypothetical protein